MLLMGNVGQQLDIHDQRDELQRLRQDLSRNDDFRFEGKKAVQKLQKENDELRLYVASLIRLLVAKQVLTAPEIAQMVTDIDAEDGTRDGKISDPIQ
ncbi:MAG: hypothetical protein A3K18_08160 [Lentisphaerae bacterium RIFOXYA12_64_32]|nr:MAG: hypothetical protein A3K18_08160 [Lentisphaerae bacterium RIFOXYA12_64_32]